MSATSLEAPPIPQLVRDDNLAILRRCDYFYFYMGGISSTVKEGVCMFTEIKTNINCCE
jgi:hypothetical protein